MKSFINRAIQPILIVTIIGTVPALVAFLHVVTTSPNPHDTDPEAVVPIAMLFVFVSVVFWFGLASLIAIGWYAFKRASAWQDIRRIRKRHALEQHDAMQL